MAKAMCRLKITLHDILGEDHAIGAAVDIDPESLHGEHAQAHIRMVLKTLGETLVGANIRDHRQDGPSKAANRIGSVLAFRMQDEWV